MARGHDQQCRLQGLARSPELFEIDLAFWTKWGKI